MSDKIARTLLGRARSNVREMKDTARVCRLLVERAHSETETKCRPGRAGSKGSRPEDIHPKLLEHLADLEGALRGTATGLKVLEESLK